jgi:tRNA modification GTPase
MTIDSEPSLPDQPRCALLTPAGRGAIATVAVRGVGAAALVGRRFQPAANRPLESLPIGRIAFGRFLTSATATEELVVGRVAADEVEIHCHGGTAAVAAVCEALVREGCALVTADRWAHNNEPDPLAADALLAVADARTERTAVLLLDQYRGALQAELAAIEQALVRGDTNPASEMLRQLLARSELGLHLANPWKVALAGRPNVGKSSLMNALVGFERAIVFPQPGTTRDVLTATTAVDGWPIELADTAGLRTAAQSLEAEGVARARRNIAAADLVIFVADVTVPWDAELHQEITRAIERGDWPGKRTLIVHNKCDLAWPPEDGRPDGLEVSAKTGMGISHLCDAIARSLVPDVPIHGMAIPFTAEQVAAIQAAADRLARGEIPAVQMLLRSLHGDG